MMAISSILYFTVFTLIIPLVLLGAAIVSIATVPSDEDEPSEDDDAL